METRRQQQQVGQYLNGDCEVLEQLQEHMQLQPNQVLASYPAAFHEQLLAPSKCRQAEQGLTTSAVPEWKQNAQTACRRADQLQSD